MAGLMIGKNEHVKTIVGKSAVFKKHVPPNLESPEQIFEKFCMKIFCPLAVEFLGKNISYIVYIFDKNCFYCISWLHMTELIQIYPIGK